MAVSDSFVHFLRRVSSVTQQIHAQKVVDERILPMPSIKHPFPDPFQGLTQSRNG